MIEALVKLKDMNKARSIFYRKEKVNMLEGVTASNMPNQ